MSAEPLNPELRNLLDDEVIAVLTTRYPRWKIRRTGNWWATRPPLSEAEGEAGCWRTIFAPTPSGLVAVLDDQERRAGKAAAS